MKDYLSIHTYCHKDINELNYQDFDSETKLDYLGPLGKINIFVGANNSGKSRFLRGLIKTQKNIITNNNRGEILNQDTSSTINKLILLCNQESFQIGFSIDHGPGIFNKENKPISDEHLNLINRTLANKKNFILLVNEKYLNTLKINFSKLFETSPVFDGYQDYLNQTYDEISVLTDTLDQNPEKKELINLAAFARLLKIEHSNKRNISNDFFNLFRQLKQILFEAKDLKFKVIQPPSKIYIPVLRTASSLFENKSLNGDYKKIHTDIFKHTIDKNYLFDDARKNNINIEVVTGLDLYPNIRKIRNNVISIRKYFEEFESFLSDTFFEGEKVEIVAKEGENEIEDNIILYIGTEERDIHHIGDGIQALIILMYTIYTAKKHSWIFIEEPELNLHPGLQRIFIEQLSKNEIIKSKSLTLFLTTHSNHLLDLSVEAGAEISIFHFEKRIHNNNDAPCFLIKNVLNSDNNLLRGLGVRSSSVFLSNCTIWVEGITDRIYVKSFLNAYYKKHPNQRKHQEDINYSFIEYAGSNLSHYIFTNNKEESKLINAQFISNNIFLLADKDSGKEKKHNDFLNQNRSGFHYEVLKAREIENILSPLQLKKYLPKLFRKILHGSLDSIQFIEKDYKSKYLGDYLLETLDTHSLPGNFRSESGALNTYYKNNLSKFVEKEVTWEEMSNEAQKLTKKIYDFIKKNND